MECGIMVEQKCRCTFADRFPAIACGFDSKDRNRSQEIIPLSECSRDINCHKSELSFAGVESEIELILARCAIFEPPKNLDNWKICPAHRALLGLSWKRKSSKCIIPVMLSKHSPLVSKRPKAERGLSKEGSRQVQKETGIFFAVGSGKLYVTSKYAYL